MNILTKKRVFLLAALLLCILSLSGVLFISCQQGDAKTIVTRSRSTSGTILSTTATTIPTLFSDNFSDNSQNWDVGGDAKHGSAINNGTLTLTATDNKPFRESLPSNIAYDDVVVETTFTLLRGDENDSVGLYLRANASTGYRVTIHGDETYDIAKIMVDASQKLHIQYFSKAQHASALHPKGQKNNLMVIMKGSNIVLLMNDTVVKSVQDGDFARGKIILFVDNGNSSDGVVASFNMVAIYAAPEHLPS